MDSSGFDMGPFITFSFVTMGVLLVSTVAFACLWLFG